MLELPLFVLLPAYYAERLGLELVAVGSVLFAARAIDAVADPVIGAGLDRNPDARQWRQLIWLALPVLVLAYAALFFPPRGVPLAAWLAASSVITYVAWSVVSIAYQAWGARLGSSDTERVRVTSWREGAGLLGVLASAALLVPDRVPALVGLFALGALAGALLLVRAPLPAGPTVTSTQSISLQPVISHGPAQPPATGVLNPWSGIVELVRCRGVRWTLAIFLVNGIASAIPATLLLFFVADILQTPDRTPQFLLSYFLAAALGMPLWNRLATRYGLKFAWLTGMALSILAFIWAWRLGAGDDAAFFVVCVATGLALGADLAIPPALLAKVLAAPDAPRARDGAAFGLWNLATKLNLAAAAGLALPVLGLLGYAPGASHGPDLAQGPEGTAALAFMYAVLPCALKLLAAVLLSIAPLARRLPPDHAPATTRNTP